MTLARTMRAMRLLNAAILGNVNGAQMQTLLADTDRLTQWQQLLTQRGQMRRMAASSTAMAAVAASSTAMAAVIASSTAMAAVAASSTAMAAVAASSTAMAAVAASSTAMAAVAASSTAMAAVAASSTAMAAVIASSTAMAAVAASSTAMAAVAASTALPPSYIPAMTSASTPSGAASASSEYSTSYPAWRAFDRTASHWDTASTGMTNQWLRYSFDSPVFVHTLELTPGSEGGPTKWRLEYSDDGANWVSAIAVPSYTPYSGVKTTHAVFAAGKHRHWRLFAETATSYCSVNEMQLLGFL